MGAAGQPPSPQQFGCLHTGADIIRAGHALSLSPVTLLRGLPAGSTIQIRISALVAGPRASDLKLRLRGPWENVQTDQQNYGCASSSRRGHIVDILKERSKMIMQQPPQVGLVA